MASIQKIINELRDAGTLINTQVQLRRDAVRADRLRASLCSSIVQMIKSISVTVDSEGAKKLLESISLTAFSEPQKH
eukprot:2117278-Pyramimonas_sp.AAC.1